MSFLPQLKTSSTDDFIVIEPTADAKSVSTTYYARQSKNTLPIERERETYDEISSRSSFPETFVMQHDSSFIIWLGPAYEGKSVEDFQSNREKLSCHLLSFALKCRLSSQGAF